MKKHYKRASDIKAGVIGYGFNMGKAHLELMQEAGMTPLAVAEIDKKRLAVAKQDFPGIEIYSSVTDMLKKSNVDLLTIITPHNTHAKLALQCLKAGRHVCCEKPMAVTTAECDKMIDVAKKNKLMLTTHHNRHWDGWILNAVKQIKQKGVIGDIVRIEAHMGGYGQPKNWWRSSKTISGGILYDWGVHFLEYALQLIDGNLTEVSGYAKTGFWADKTIWKDDTNEDEGYLVARFDSGQWITLTISSIDSYPKRVDRGMLEITGTKGTYIMDTTEYKIIKWKKDEQHIVTGKNPPSEYWRFYKNLAEHLVKGEKLIITPEWARRPIHILDLACKSAEKNKSIPAKYN